MADTGSSGSSAIAGLAALLAASDGTAAAAAGAMQVVWKLGKRDDVQHSSISNSMQGELPCAPCECATTLVLYYVNGVLRCSGVFCQKGLAVAMAHWHNAQSCTRAEQPAIDVRHQWNSSASSSGLLAPCGVRTPDITCPSPPYLTRPRFYPPPPLSLSITRHQHACVCAAAYLNRRCELHEQHGLHACREAATAVNTTAAMQLAAGSTNTTMAARVHR